MARSFEWTRRQFLGGTLAAGVAACESPAFTAAAEPRAGWQIGCRTRPWAAYDYRVALDAVAEAGFKYIGFGGAKSKTGWVIGADTPLEEAAHVGEETRKRGLEIPLIYSGDLAAQKGPATLRRIIDNCAACGAWSVVIAGLGDAKTWERYCQVIADCCDYATQKKVTLTLKPHGGNISTGPLCRKAIERVHRKNFTVLYDPGNVYYYSDGKIDPVDDVAAVASLVTGMLIKDYRYPKNVDVTPGTGQVRFRELMARLAKGGFTHGPLIVETLTPGNLSQLLAEAKRARKYVAELVGNRA
jgi:sugar phosphate isomerase/epimerase